MQSIASARSTFSPHGLIVQYIGLDDVESGEADARSDSLATIAHSTYDQQRRFVQRLRRRVEFDTPFEQNFTPLYSPSFALARSASSTSIPPFRFSLDWDTTKGTDTIDRHTFLHVGYAVSECGKWLAVACIDQRGEEEAVELVDLEDDESAKAGAHLPSKEHLIAALILRIAGAHFLGRAADVEWALMICSLGAVTPRMLRGQSLPAYLGPCIVLTSVYPKQHGNPR